MAATTVTTRAVKGSALSHTEADTNWNNLNNVGVGVGHISIWPTDTLPDATWLFCRGGSYAVASYPDLFDEIGYMYGGSGANFNVPDFRGMFIRGKDDGAGVDLDAASRTDRGDGTTGDNVGTNQEDAAQAHYHTIANGDGTTGGLNSGNYLASNNSGQWFGYTLAGSGSTPSIGRTSSTTGSETRPINISMNFIIKALL